MPSPFPGMNPYLEQPGVWPNSHTQMLTAFVAQVVPQVVPNSVVQLEERISLQEPADGPDRPLGRADLTVASGSRNRRRGRPVRRPGGGAGSGRDRADRGEP